MMLKVSICVTVFNEKKEIVHRLLQSLIDQTMLPSEIIIVSAGHDNKVQSVISNFKFLISNQFPKLNFQFIKQKNISRSEGRNLAIRKAKNENIAITDAGAIPRKDWLKNLTKPFLTIKPFNHLVVAGAYQMIAKNSFQEAESVFLGVQQKDIDENFMPSARSMAFTKSIWEKAGGFPENLNDTAEDTLFNLRLLKAGAKFVVIKDAVVDWQMPDSIKNFYLKIKNYARGDAQSGIWWHPIKKWQTHNIKILTIFLRYLVLIGLLIFSKPFFWIYVLCYMLYGYSKAKFWGIILQFVSDFAGIIGFSHGLLSKGFKRT